MFVIFFQNGLSLRVFFRYKVLGWKKILLHYNKKASNKKGKYQDNNNEG